MPENELTAVQRNLLIAMMISAAPLLYKSVTNSLAADKRDELVAWGYLEKSGRPMLLELTQRGHDRAVVELESGQPTRQGLTNLLMDSAIGFVRNLLVRSEAAPQDLFRFRIAGLVPVKPVGDIEERIRKVYSSMSVQPGDYVMLENLREALADIGRVDFDAAIIELNRLDDVSLIPESNQAVLTSSQRAAGVRIGNQLKHLLAIGV